MTPERVLAIQFEVDDEAMHDEWGTAVVLELLTALREAQAAHDGCDKENADLLALVYELAEALNDAIDVGVQEGLGPFTKWERLLADPRVRGVLEP